MPNEWAINFAAWRHNLALPFHKPECKAVMRPACGILFNRMTVRSLAPSDFVVGNPERIKQEVGKKPERPASGFADDQAEKDWLRR